MNRVETKTSHQMLNLLEILESNEPCMHAFKVFATILRNKVFAFIKT